MRIRRYVRTSFFRGSRKNSSRPEQEMRCLNLVRHHLLGQFIHNEISMNPIFTSMFCSVTSFVLCLLFEQEFWAQIVWFDCGSGWKSVSVKCLSQTVSDCHYPVCSMVIKVNINWLLDSCVYIIDQYFALRYRAIIPLLTYIYPIVPHVFLDFCLVK